MLMSDSYNAQLESQEWEKKRSEILKRDGFRCQMCGGTGSDDNPLNVHHRYYIYKKKAWEYDESTLITLCRHCHVLIHKSTSPLIYYEDNERLAPLRLTPCIRCHGAGFFPEFRHVNNGVCFRCNGSRYEELFNNHSAFTLDKSVLPSADSFDLIRVNHTESENELNYLMGRNSHFGLNGYERNLKTAYDFYFKSAIQGYGKAQKILGDIFKYGTDEINVDYVKARRWYSYAAMQGNYEAFSSLADIFRRGLGVEENNLLFKEWRSLCDNKEATIETEWIAPEMSLSTFVTLHGECKPKQRIDKYTGLTIHSIDAHDGTSADFSQELETELEACKTEGKKYQLDINRLVIREYRIISINKSGFLAYYSDNSSSPNEYCSNYLSIKYMGEETYTDPVGVIYSIDKTHLIEFPLSLNITEYTILDTCQFIDDNAFKADVDPGNCIDDLKYYGNQLSKLSLPEGLKAIGKYAFKGCRNLESIRIPASVECIGFFAFNGCENLKSVTVDVDNPIYDSRDSCNAIIQTVDNTLVYGCRNSYIPDTVRSIGKSAFAQCEGLTEIFIPASIETIGDAAFDFCRELKKINLPIGLGYVGKGVFYHCTSLREVYLNSMLDSVNYKTFEDCWSLKNIFVQKEQYEFYRELFSFTPLIQFIRKME